MLVWLFTHDAVSVGVPHVLVSRVFAVDWRYTVGPGFAASDPAVVIVVVQGEGVYFPGRGGCWGRGCCRAGVEQHHLG